MGSTQTRLHKDKAAPKAAARKASTATSAMRGNGEKRPSPALILSAQERDALIARVAYMRAEKRGFAPGNEWEDWFQAQAEVLMLTGGH